MLSFYTEHWGVFSFICGFLEVTGSCLLFLDKMKMNVKGKSQQKSKCCLGK